MARMARLVVPNFPHHDTQRGNLRPVADTRTIKFTNYTFVYNQVD